MFVGIFLSFHVCIFRGNGRINTFVILTFFDFQLISLLTPRDDEIHTFSFETYGMLIGTSSSFSKVRFRTTLLKSLRRRADRDSSSVLEMVLSFTRIQWDFVLSDDVTLSTFSSLMTISLLFFEFFLRLWRFPASSNALTAWTFRLTWPWRDTPAPILNRILSTTLSCEKTSDLRFLLLLIYPLLREF